MPERNTLAHRRGVAVLALTSALLTGGCGFVVPDSPDRPAQPPSLPVAGSDAFAPYIDVGVGEPADPGPVAWDHRIKHVNLGFITDHGGCTPQWGGVNTLHDRATDGRLASLRSIGVEQRISFGGAAGTELAAGCADADALARAYQQVIDAYGVTRIDFDLEAQTLSDPIAVERRNQAIRKLQDAARAQGHPLDVSYTLPGTPTGLDLPAEQAVRGAAAAGVQLTAVNLLAMDYGGGVTGNLGRPAVDSANALRAQLGTIWPAESDAALWKKVAVTVMPGRNDDPAEVFDLTDARGLADFAQRQHLGWLSLWSLSRDAPCAEEHHDQETCSGIGQAPYEFSQILASYRG